MHSALHAILVGDQPKFAELGLHGLFGEALHRALVAQPIADEIGNRADLERMLAGKSLELRTPRHAAIVVHELAQHASGLQAREHAQIHSRLGVPRADQHAAAPRAQWKDVPGSREVLRG